MPRLIKPDLPFKPSFHARLSGSNDTGFTPSDNFGDRVDYNTIELNHGGHFQSSGSDVGLFIAPVRGAYMFSAAAYSSVDAFVQSWFVVNAARHSGTDNSFPSSNFAEITGIIIHCNAGDKVGYHPYKGGSGTATITIHQQHTWFKGCLLEAL